jgi:prephenate dehydratase
MGFESLPSRLGDDPNFSHNSKMTLTDAPSLPHSSLRLGCLGPQGSHSHQAALGAIDLLGLHDRPVTLVPVATLGALMAHLEAGELELAILPYENALEGSVVEVLETLGTGKRRLFVHAEFLQPVAHCLIQRAVPAGTTPAPVHTVLSHPMGLAQCRETLTRLYGPLLTHRQTSSTSEAVKQLAAMDDPTGYAAIANATAADLFDLTVVHPDVSDANDNLTRFFVASAQPVWPAQWPALPAHAESKTSVCFALPEYPGVLMKYLRLFYQFQVNLTKLESRPTRLRYGDYRFFADCDIDVTTVACGTLLQELKRQATFFHCQGPYKVLGYSPAHSIPATCRANRLTDLMEPITIMPHLPLAVPLPLTPIDASSSTSCSASTASSPS